MLQECIWTYLKLDVQNTCTIEHIKGVKFRPCKAHVRCSRYSDKTQRFPCPAKYCIFTRQMNVSLYILGNLLWPPNWSTPATHFLAKECSQSTHTTILSSPFPLWCLHVIIKAVGCKREVFIQKSYHTLDTIHSGDIDSVLTVNFDAIWNPKPWRTSVIHSNSSKQAAVA